MKYIKSAIAFIVSISMAVTAAFSGLEGELVYANGADTTYMALTYASEEENESSCTDIVLEEGTYEEHEAVAYVIGYDDSEDEGFWSWLFGEDVLEDAESLMDVDAVTVEEALSESESSQIEEVAQMASEYLEELDSALESVGEDVSEAEGQLILVHNDDMTTEELIEKLQEDDRVVFAEPNYITETIEEDDDASESLEELALELSEDAEDEESDDADMSAETMSLADISDESGIVVSSSGSDDSVSDLNDFFWAGYNSGLRAGIDESLAVDIDYDDWESQTVSEDLDTVVVAVVDSGIDGSNEDIADVLWSWNDESTSVKNTLRRISGSDEHGCFPDNTSRTKTSTSGFSEGYDHGTHVAGIIAASWDGEGISGVSSNAKIMSVRHSETISSLISCAEYVTAAAEAGVNVRVCNNSWNIGYSATQAINVAYTAMGEAGVMSVFSSGNNGSDNDRITLTASALADNPYVVIVNAVNEEGNLASFSDYGGEVTDVMAPGTAVLSSVLTDYPTYLAEADKENAAIYESFDDESCTMVEDLDGEEQYFSFYNKSTGATVGTIMEGVGFDGDSALALTYTGTSSYNNCYSEDIDLSGLDEMPEYMSIRYRSYGVEESVGLSGYAQLLIYVKTVDSSGTTSYTKTSYQGLFSTGGTWCGFYVELPDDTDWEAFSIRLYYVNALFSDVGEADYEITNGTVLIDSIGLGSGTVAYNYKSGTSMAAPVVSGVAAVLAGGIGSDDSAKKLAARIKGSTVYAKRYEDLCSAEGYVTVSGGYDPGAVPVSVEDNGDGTALVEAYFADSSTEAFVNGEQVTIESVSTDSEGLSSIIIDIPDSYTGGACTVGLSGSGANPHEITVTAYLEDDSTQSYYDETGLEYPEEIEDWGNWNLVGFDGKVYLMPRSSMDTDGWESFTVIYAYDIDEESWEEVNLPVSSLPKYGNQSGYLVDVTAATYGEQMIFILTAAYSSGAVCECVFSMSEDQEWELLGSLDEAEISSSTTSAYIYGTLCSDGDNVYLFGAYMDTYGTGGGILSIDMDSYEVTYLGSLDVLRVMPSVSCGDGSFIVSGGLLISSNYPAATGAELVTIDDDSFEISEIDFDSEVEFTGLLSYAGTAVEDGFAIVGPENMTGDADTYITDNEGANISAYEKRASSLSVLSPAATAYRGKLYVMAMTNSGDVRIFASTSMDTADQPGDTEYTKEETETSGEESTSSSEEETEDVSEETTAYISEETTETVLEETTASESEETTAEVTAPGEESTGETTTASTSESDTEEADEGETSGEESTTSEDNNEETGGVYEEMTENSSTESETTSLEETGALSGENNTTSSSDYNSQSSESNDGDEDKESSSSSDSSSKKDNDNGSDTVTIKKITYKILSKKNKTAQVIGSKKKIKKAKIRAKVVINGQTYKVTKIKAKAFRKRKKLKKVVIGKNVRIIGKRAFFKCRKLRKVKFKGSALKKVKKKAFSKTPVKKQARKLIKKLINKNVS